MLRLALHVDPRPVAVARIGLALAALINTLEMYALLSGLAAGKLAMPLTDWVPSVSHVAVQVVLAVGVTASVSILLGVGTAAAAIAYSLTMGTVLLWDQQTYSSHQVIVVLLIAYLAFARSDRAYSLVSRGRPRREVPWWPQLLMMTQLSALYLFAGLSKINHMFLPGDALAGWMRYPLPEWVYQPMAVATIVTEMGLLAVGLWVPRLRMVAVVAGMGLHLSILTLLADSTIQLVAFALACVPLYPLFLARPSLRRYGQDDPGPLMTGAPGPTLS
ncbi:hypothetical protein ASG73_12195 [Janibacter sp. Soil728]|uniref:HTTM domain-containing protein n=1 Tax=Janibacter sp. Soil728 TaxID=1736393 RepID=UPI000701E58D|nr:HTTM domain-containing protein [Janibacter sp. Soil728]KRE37058.1 hypothetical protein ASG73_12195 [Janibacter sp. Soil728]